MSIRSPTSGNPSGKYFSLGLMCAILSLILLPEIFGSASVIFGATAWKEQPDRNTGRNILILGIICTWVGFYLTAYPVLYDLIFWS
jgi:hypothetical protein